MPPTLALISSTAISTTSRSDTSLMAIVPESECRTPIFTVSCALRMLGNPRPAPSAVPAASEPLRKPRREISAIPSPFASHGVGLDRGVIGASCADVIDRGRFPGEQARYRRVFGCLYEMLRWY